MARGAPAPFQGPLVARSGGILDNIRGIALVVLSMAAFTIEDMFIKSLTTAVPTGQVLFFLGTGGAMFFALMARAKGHRLLRPFFTMPTLRIRTLGEAVASVFFVTSLSLVPLATVAAVFQALPLAATLAAALFMGERVGWRRWAAICVGFSGVVLIIRPGMAGFNAASLLVLAAVAGITLRDLISRRLPSDLPSTVVSFHGFMALVVVGPLLVWARGQTLVALDLHQSLFMAAAIGFGVLGYYAIVIATRTADASVITPFRYTRLLFSILIGIAVFNEIPDGLTYAGAALIVGSGLYTFMRERRLARQSAAIGAR